MTTNRFLSRKFLLALAVLVSATVLVWLGHIADGVYSAVVISAVASYFTANVAQKATVKNAADRAAQAKKAGAWLAIALAAVAVYEGLSLTEYPDIGGVPTICYGETKGVSPGDVATKEQCDEKLSLRLVEFNEGVDSCVHVALPDSRRAALVSLSYNVGTRAFCDSTVVRKINAGDIYGACNAVLAFNKVKGKTVRGLTVRREKEREMCLKGLTWTN